MHQVPAVPLRVGADNVTPVSSVRDLGVYLDTDAYMANEATQTHCYNPVVPAYLIWAY